jgi:dipeptidyl aminopeptidase/acylaminoacyl peptidase
MVSRKYLIYISVAFVSIKSFSQTELLQRNGFLASSLIKPVLDSSVFNKWTEVSGGAISNDGKYISYILQEKNTSLLNPLIFKYTAVVTNSVGSWKWQVDGTKAVQFSADSKYAVYINRGDSLCILKLGSKQYTAVPGIGAFQLLAEKKGEQLVYQSNSKNGRLVIRSFNGKREQGFEDVNRYAFSPDGQILVVERPIENNGTKVEWIMLNDGKPRVIWSNKQGKLGQFLFDKSSKQVAFSVNEKGVKSIWLYSSGTEQANKLVVEGANKIDSSLSIENMIRFSDNGDRIFFMLSKKRMPTKQRPDVAKVTVWGYDDLVLQSEREKNSLLNRLNYLSVLDTRDGKVMRLQNDFERVNLTPGKGYNDDFCLISQPDVGNGVNKVDGDQLGTTILNSANEHSKLYLVSTRNADRKLLPWRDSYLALTYLSPRGKYVIYKNNSDLQYYSYELTSGNMQSITKDIHADLSVDDGYRLSPNHHTLIDVGGWLTNDAGIFIYDRYDIWLVDPSGKKMPQNITNDYGGQSRIILRLANRERDNHYINWGDRLILAALNARTMENGFFQIRLGVSKYPEKLIMESCLFTYPLSLSNLYGNLIKAKDRDAWLLTRQKASESPNYYYSTDLKRIHPISDNYPEKPWNWITAELHTWKTQDGDTLQGILYKPENFDSSKKYPVIFDYYRQVSQDLHLYKNPAGTDGYLNAPWFVSHGYLLFTPDIHHRIPDLKESVISCITSAAKHLRDFAYIDTNRIGLYGHSFGGLETGYMITSNSLFAAAVTACGYYDLISDVGTIIDGTGISRGGPAKLHTGGTLWEKPDEYVKNSSIFNLDKVTMPVLIMTGEKDGQVPHNQSVELFLGLRELGKKSWMLSYEDGNHFVISKKDVDDYTIRCMQFFDHYLKGAPAPKWMTRGIPVSEKGTDTGYELDPGGSCGKGCAICQHWNSLQKGNATE